MQLEEGVPVHWLLECIDKHFGLRLQQRGVATQLEQAAAQVCRALYRANTLSHFQVIPRRTRAQRPSADVLGTRYRQCCLETGPMTQFTGRMHLHCA